MVRPRYLFVRNDAGNLIGELDRTVHELRRRHPGRTVSRESLVRELLWTALRRGDAYDAPPVSAMEPKKSPEEFIEDFTTLTTRDRHRA